MAVFLSPVAGAAAQFLDNSGNVLTGGKLYTYAAGTTTPQATYTSSAGITALSNPIILDAAGRVPTGEIWLTDSLVYKFVLKDSNDVLIATWDNLTGINSNFVNYTVQEEIQTATAGQTVFNLTTINYTPGSNSLQVFVDGVNQYDGSSYAYVETNSTTVTFTSGLHVGALVKFTNAISNSSGIETNASLVTYDPPFTGGVSTTVENKLAQYVSIKDFGAVGDGVADDTVAIQAALSAGGGGEVYVPEGTYKLTDSLTVTAGTYFHGTGPNSSLVQHTNNIPIIYAQSERTKISDLGLVYNALQINPNVWSNAIHCQTLYESILERLYIFNAYHGIYCKRYTTNNADATGNYMYSCRVSDIRIDTYGGQALYIGSVNNSNSGNVFTNIYTINQISNPVLHGATFESWDDGVITQLNIERATHTGPSLVLSACGNLTFNSLHFEGIECATDQIGFIDAGLSRAVICGLTLAFNTQTAPVQSSICRINDSEIILLNVQERDNTISAALKPIFYGVGTTGSGRVIGPSVFQNYNLPYNGTPTYGYNAVDEYEVGVWTPVVSSSAGAITTVGAVSGWFTKIGNLVTTFFDVVITTNGTGSGYIVIGGLPFTPDKPGKGSGREDGVNGWMIQVNAQASSTNLAVFKYDGSYPGGNGYRLVGQTVYQT